MPPLFTASAHRMEWEMGWKGTPCCVSHCFSFISVMVLLGFPRSNSVSDCIVSLAKGQQKLESALLKKSVVLMLK